METPDKWILIKVGGDDPHYRLFASWSGSYVEGESWRLNSGVVNVTEDDNYYYFEGYSGSVYKCHKNRYGVAGGYNAAVLQRLVETHINTKSGETTIVEDYPDNIMMIDWEKPTDQPKLLDVELREYYHECGDGCCSEWGTTLIIDGTVIGDYYNDESLLRLVANHFGYEIGHIDHSSESDDDA